MFPCVPRQNPKLGRGEDNFAAYENVNRRGGLSANVVLLATRSTNVAYHGLQVTGISEYQRES